LNILLDLTLSVLIVPGLLAATNRVLVVPTPGAPLVNATLLQNSVFIAVYGDFASDLSLEADSISFALRARFFIYNIVAGSYFLSRVHRIGMLTIRNSLLTGLYFVFTLSYGSCSSPSVDALPCNAPFGYCKIENTTASSARVFIKFARFLFMGSVSFFFAASSTSQVSFILPLFPGITVCAICCCAWHLRL
jgi:hypothetical protein